MILSLGVINSSVRDGLLKKTDKGEQANHQIKIILTEGVNKKDYKVAQDHPF